MNSFVISREGRRSSLTSVFGKFDFHCFSLSLFVASSFAASRGLFTHSRVHKKATTFKRSQQDWPMASTEFLIDQTFTSSDCDGCVEQKSASLRRRRSAGWRAPYRSLSAPLDRHTNYFVEQHTAEHRWSAGTLPAPSSQVKPPTVRLPTIKFIRKEKNIYFNSSVCTELFVFW